MWEMLLESGAERPIQSFILITDSSDLNRAMNVLICMRLDSIQAICAEMNGRVDRSAPFYRKMLGNIPYDVHE